MNNEKLKHTDKSSIVYVIQDVPGSKIGAPKINIIGATQFGQLKVLLPENSQIILSPSYVITTLRSKLKDDIAADATLFTKYKVKGDARPDNVALDVYQDSTGTRN